MGPRPDARWRSIGRSVCGERVSGRRAGCGACRRPLRARVGLADPREDAVQPHPQRPVLVAVAGRGGGPSWHRADTVGGVRAVEIDRRSGRPHEHDVCGGTATAGEPGDERGHRPLPRVRRSEATERRALAAVLIATPREADRHRRCDAGGRRPRRATGRPGHRSTARNRGHSGGPTDRPRPARGRHVHVVRPESSISPRPSSAPIPPAGGGRSGPRRTRLAFGSLPGLS